VGINKSLKPAAGACSTMQAQYYKVHY
jgi:hypothetical protein